MEWMPVYCMLCMECLGVDWNMELYRFIGISGMDWILRCGYKNVDALLVVAPTIAFT